MIKLILKPYLVFFLLLILPFAGLCQIPHLKWVDDLGAVGDSKPTGLITDAQNNIYITGIFEGTVDFDPSAGVKNLTSVGGYDTYVAKYTSAGALIWAISMGGNGLDQVNNMTVDAGGNPTITGQYNSTNFIAGSVNLLGQGSDDIFIIHMDTNGNILWGKTIGGSTTDRGEEVNADNQGNLIETAIFQSTITIGASTFTGAGVVYNGLVIKYDPSGNLIWAIDLGGSGDTEIYGNASDSNGNIVVSGSYSGSVDFDPLGIHHTLINGSNTPFLAEYTPAGKLIWVNTLNGSFVGNQSVVAIGTNNNIYLSAAFSSLLQFNPSTALNALGQDTFIAGYSSNGTFQFAKDLGGSGASSFPYQIRSDATNNVYVSGYFSGTIDFNPDPAVTANVTYHGQRDFFLVKLDQNGLYQWAFGGGSPNCDQTLGVELAVDTNNDVVLGGSFCSTVNFDSSACGLYNLSAQNGISDTFIAKYIQGTPANSAITSFTVPQQISIPAIDQVNHKITVIVAPGTDVKTLTPTVIVSNGGTVSPTSGVAENFTSPVVYTVSACIPVPYTVTVAVYIAKIDTTCSAAANIVTGDAASPVPDSYTWQLFQANVWNSAPGVTTNKDYQTSALTNNTNAVVTYQLRRQISVGGVISYDSFYNVTVMPVIAITNNVITQPAVTSFCLNGDPGNIVGSIPVGGTGVYIYQWQSSTDNVTFTNISAKTQSFDPPVINATTYYRRSISSGACVPPSISNVITMTVNPLPQVTAAGVSICQGTGATLTAASTDQNAVINWYAAASGGNILFTGKTFTTPVLNSGTTYYAEASDSNTGCTSATRATATVQIIQQLAAPIVTVQATTSSSITFQWSAVTGATGYQVSIDNGQTFITPSSGSNGLTHTVSGLQPQQSITILVQATGNSNCQLSGSSTAVTAVAVSPIGNLIFVPNAFTPNGDGKNDVVYVHSENIKSLKFYVYDQWGELLYTSLSQQNGWDGTYKGTKEPVGVYVYYLEAIMIDGQQITKKGTIALLR